MDEEQVLRLKKATAAGIRITQGNETYAGMNEDHTIPGFNDASNTTHEDVILALKHAETLLDEK